MSVTPKYTVDGWGKDWFVVARNNKTVARCSSKKWATKIATLLSIDASMADYLEASKEMEETRLTAKAAKHG
jgi:hypothetical protein